MQNAQVGPWRLRKSMDSTFAQNPPCHNKMFFLSAELRTSQRCSFRAWDLAYMLSASWHRRDRSVNEALVCVLIIINNTDSHVRTSEELVPDKSNRVSPLSILQCSLILSASLWNGGGRRCCGEVGGAVRERNSRDQGILRVLWLGAVPIRLSHLPLQC